MSLHAACISRIRAQRIVWHFCTPKSASTFLMRCLQQAVAKDDTIGHLRCVPMHKNRPQAVCAYTVAQSIGDRNPDHTMLGPHLHALATNDLLDMISDNHLVVIQTRPLLDTIVSYFDHLDKNPSTAFSITGDSFWSELDASEKIDYITHTYVPWHIQFMQSWDRASVSKNIKWVTYDQVVSDSNRAVSDILSGFAQCTAPLEKLPSENIKFNVGRAGRGKQNLSPDQISRIAGVVKSLTKPWEPHRCSPYASIAL